MIKDDLCAMLDELADLPEKSVNADLFEEIRSSQVADDGESERITNPSYPKWSLPLRFRAAAAARGSSKA